MSSEETTKRGSKDSVFCDLFSDESYVFQLYKDLHPEDQDADARDVCVRTIKSTFINTLYNDLGFTVGDKYVLLVEAQSVWDRNIPMRMLFYLSETYKRYLADTNQPIHSKKLLNVPKPDLYVVYSGDEDVPDVVSFKETYFSGVCSFELEVNVLKTADVGTIYGQYVGFCKVYDEQRKHHGNGVECAKETIRICIEKGYLVRYLNEHKKEVITMLDELFNEEALQKAYIQEEKQESLEQGRAEGRAEGRKEGMEMTINLLIQAGFSPEAINKALNPEGGASATF